MIYRLRQPLRTSPFQLKRIMFGIVAMFVFFAPLSYAFAADADSSTSSSSACTPVTPASSGITYPTGADASTYTFDPCSGLYIGPYYTWSPATQTATPITPYVYSCDTSNWDWTYLQWFYSPASSSWYQATITVAQLPAGAAIDPGSLTICAPAPPAPVVNSADPTTQNTSGTNGPGAASSTDSTASTSATLNSNNTANLNNNLNSQALSGNAIVLGNTTGGDATSGNAAAEANVLNSLQSSTSAPVATFVANINGDVQGNLIVDPSQLQPTTTDSTLNTTNNLTINSQNTGNITNNLNLNSATGNATVANNTTAGNATSGNAEAIANVVNMIDSVISSGQSFIGVININGNLTGDILMPQNFYNSLIASNAPSATVNISNSVANSLGINTTNNEAINNNVTSSATSGSAAVNNNTSAGSATSGNSSTAVKIFNLTGNEIIGTNALLVFVNVPGAWVGVILNAPGATAAALGSDISNATNNTNINATNNSTINNNVDVAAASGNAAVNNNTSAGNATSGNAETAVNFLNLDNTQFDLTGWFGILFINVFGTWIGNFGVYTPPVTTTTSSDPSSTSPTTNTPPKVFSFAPTSGYETSDSSSTSSLNAQLISKKSVLGSATVVPFHTPAVVTSPVSHTSQIVGGILLAIGVGTLLAQQLISNRRHQSSSKTK